jgi:hypothetical protein
MSLRLASEYPFLLNRDATSYRREHPNRGTNTLSEQRKQDRLLLSRIIHDEIGFKKFFKNISNISQSWAFMGQVYEQLGSLDYAEECYNNSANKSGFVGQLTQRRNVLRLKGKSLFLIKFLNFQILILNKATLWFHKILPAFK